VGRLVLVQPSVYGHDNSLLLAALWAQPGRHRGVVVLGGHETEAQLDAMAEAGVRGVRFNAVSPLGNAADALQAMAPRIRARGWHLQWYVPPARWAEVAALSHQHGLVAVLDHLAGITPGAWAQAALPLDALARLADQGAWLKLSGWYRLHSNAPFNDVQPAITVLVRQFDGRCVWGSDWPHTRYLEPGVHGPVPGYASLMAPACAALTATQWQHVLHAAAKQLYC
jgi:predicted TIM-barrel fold metal-dependent hydrolase